MADFQPMPMGQLAPQPFQLPGPAQINSQPGVMQGVASGIQSGLQLGQGQQALNMQSQQLAMQQQNAIISQVDTLLKSGMNYPGMLPTFWPAIATRMNSLSPDYKLDPNNPPDNLPNFAKQLSSISDGLQDKVVSPPQAHAATLQLIKSSFPSPVPDSASPTTSSQGTPQAQPIQPPNGGKPQPTDSLSNFVAIKARYDQANQLISQAPMEGPQSQENLRKQLENSSLGLEYKKALDQLATSANEKYTEGAQNQRNQYNQDQDSIRSLTGSFESQSQDAKNVFDNLNVFNSMMQQSRQFQGAKDTTSAVNAEKASLLAFAQMAYPGTGRPGNMEMLENMEKSGPFGTLIAQGLNKLDKGEIMTDSQIRGLRQAAVGIAQAREKSQSDQENTTAQAIQMHGGNPTAFLRNYRPSSIVSTSKLFPNQNPNAIGTTRKLTINGKQGTYKLIGTNGSDPDNWVPADE